MSTIKGPWPWPASRLTPEMMHAMHCVREQSMPRKTISNLVAEAVATQYGMNGIHPINKTTHDPEEAA